MAGKETTWETGQVIYWLNDAYGGTPALLDKDAAAIRQYVEDGLALPELYDLFDNPNARASWERVDWEEVALANSAKDGKQFIFTFRITGKVRVCAPVKSRAVGIAQGAVESLEGALAECTGVIRAHLIEAKLYDEQE